MAANSVARPRAAAPAGRRCSALRRAAAAAPRQQTRLPSSSLSASLSVDDAPVVQPVEAAQWREYEKAGWVLLDVRPAEEVAVVAPLRSVNVPLYISDPDRSPGALLRQAITWYATFAWWSGGGHTNREFLREVGARVPKAGNPGVVVACQQGLRSLKAAEELVKAGYPSVAWLAGGFDDAQRVDFDTTTGKSMALGGVGGLQGVLGWTKAQSKEEGGGFAGGVQNVLLAVAFVGFLDVLSLGYQLVFNQVTPPPAA